MITVKPHGGLGNRMRVLYSILALNAELNSDIRIIWDCAKKLNCPFDELFVRHENCKVRNIHGGFFRDVEKFFMNRLGFTSLRRLRYDKIFYDQDVIKLRNNNHEIDFIKLFKNVSVFMESCYEFYPNAYKKVDFFQPQEAIRKRAENVYRNFNNNTFGVHIRRTDNVRSITNSPLSIFKIMIRKKIEADPNATFFLATDSREVETELKKDFKENIIFRSNKKLDRNSPEGIKDALVDMICLSKTRKVYGSFGSSFSILSALMSGIEFEHLVKEA